jgi:hypothetical protein
MTSTLVITITGKDAEFYTSKLSELIAGFHIKQLDRKWWQLCNPYELRMQNVDYTTIDKLTLFLMIWDVPAKIEYF